MRTVQSLAARPEVETLAVGTTAEKKVTTCWLKLKVETDGRDKVGNGGRRRAMSCDHTTQELCGHLTSSCAGSMLWPACCGVNRSHVTTQLAVALVQDWNQWIAVSIATASCDHTTSGSWSHDLQLRLLYGTNPALIAATSFDYTILGLCNHMTCSCACFIVLTQPH